MERSSSFALAPAEKMLPELWVLVLDRLCSDVCPECHKPWIFNIARPDFCAFRATCRRFNKAYRRFWLHRSMPNKLIPSGVTYSDYCLSPEECVFAAGRQWWHRMAKMTGVLTPYHAVHEEYPPEWWRARTKRTGRRSRGEDPSNW